MCPRKKIQYFQAKFSGLDSAIWFFALTVCSLGLNGNWTSRLYTWYQKTLFPCTFA